MSLLVLGAIAETFFATWFEEAVILPNSAPESTEIYMCQTVEVCGGCISFERVCGRLSQARYGRAAHQLSKEICC
jgi:hypothetical protein